MKKKYLKPDAEYILFYSEEELTETSGSLSNGNVDVGEGEGDDSWH